MVVTKNTTMQDFLVTFFIEDQANTQMLSDILKHNADSMFWEILRLPKNFTFPFFQESGETSVICVLKQGVNELYEVTVNGYSCDEHIVRSGDYFAFKDRSSNITVKVLFIATSDVQISYQKYKLTKGTNIFIGRTPLNDISFDFTDFVSREKHAAIRIDGDGNAFIEDLKRSVGIYVNGKMTHSQQLKIFDEVFIMGLSIIFMGDYIAVRNLKVESTLPEVTTFVLKIPVSETEKNYFVSTPRILKSLDVDEIEIDAPPSPFTVDETPVILALGPSLTMSLVMLASLSVSLMNAISGGELSTIIASGTMAVGMLLGALMWPTLLRNYQKRCILADEEHRKQRYYSYIAYIEKQLISKRDRTIRILNDSMCPSPEILCTMLDSDNNKLRLWERSHEDDDFLDVRIGLGNRPFDVKIKTPKQRFQLYEDELCNLPAEISVKYGSLINVPLTLDIYHNRTIGIIGSRKNMCIILNEIILNLISLHPCDEVKLVLIVSPKQTDIFDDFKNVPHIWSNDKRVRYFATNPDEVHFVFNVIDETLKEREELQNETVSATPHFVFIVTAPHLIEKEAMLRYINDSDNHVGITTIFAYGDITRLPKSCKTVIQSDESRTGYYIKNKNANKFISFTLDSINIDRIRAFAKTLSQLPIKRDTRSMGIVDRISFLQMYKAGNVNELRIEQHWDNNNSAKSLAAPIGVMAGGEVFSLDLHEAYHGCHGLVAGTTGSGKSEFLQAFILSLAINYSPKEVAFVLVDFKGGDMARPFMAKKNAPPLPHLSATISNLSGNILYRALVSLEAEIKTRQCIFNEAAASLGVDKLDINSYHKYYKGGRLDTPLPHLVIIIDEFAQLKNQQPDFLTQLINVAQVGRSLGIHLILATQKPSGIVDPQIMSNSRFRVCLKVSDKQDSIDMINKPDSALIKNPGRLYLQVGYDEIYECVQAGYSGADYVPTKTYMPDEEITVQMTDNTANPIYSAKMDVSGEKSDKTQLEAVVAEIVALGQKKKITTKSLWLDVLPEKVVMSSLTKGKKGICSATIGLVDYIRTQEQKSLIIDFVKTGHIGLYGASGTGKTTFLQTLVYSMVCDYGYTPEELNVYALDFGGRNLGYLENLPHTGGVVFADDESKVSELVVVLAGIIDERKHLFSSNNCGTFADYRAIAKNPLPAILVLIDNFASFRDRYMDASESLINIISAGKTFGIYFVITGNTRNSIHYRVTEHIASYFTLKMNDPNNYLDIHNMRSPIVPEDVSGRGITVINKEIVEFQTAIAFDGETEADRIIAISQKYNELAVQWNGVEPIGLTGYIDSKESETGSGGMIYYTSPDKSNSPESVYDDSSTLILGSSKSGALLYGITLSEEYKVCVCSNEVSELIRCYKFILKNINQYSDRRVVFVGDNRKTYSNIAEMFPSCTYISSCAELDSFIEDLKPELNFRLEHPNNVHERLFIVISEFNEFFHMISDEQAAFMRKVFRYINSPCYGIYFLCGFNVNGEKNNDGLFMSLVVNAEAYLLCPDCYGAASIKIETLPSVQQLRNENCYFCLREKSVELRW